MTYNTQPNSFTLRNAFLYSMVFALVGCIIDALLNIETHTLQEAFFSRMIIFSFLKSFTIGLSAFLGMYLINRRKTRTKSTN
jgi:uncharacterized membrane protein